MNPNTEGPHPMDHQAANALATWATEIDTHLNDHGEAIDVLIARVDDLTPANLADLTTRVADLTDRVSNHNERLANNNTRLISHSNDLGEHDQAIADLTARVAARVADIAGLNELLDGHTARLDGLDTAISQIKQRNGHDALALAAALEAIDHRLVILNDAIDVTSTTLASTNNDHSSRLDSLEDKTEDNASRIRTVSIAQDQLSSLVDAYPALLAAQADRLDGQNVRFEAALATVDNRIAAVRESAATNAAYAADLADRDAENRADLATAIETIDNRIAQLAARVAALEDTPTPTPDPTPDPDPDPDPDPVLVAGPAMLTPGPLGRGDNPGDPAHRLWEKFDRATNPPSPTEDHHTSAGTAPIEALDEPGVIRAYLLARDQVPLHGSATGITEEHLPFTPTPDIRMSVDVRFPDLPDWPYDPGKTGKLGGVHVWDGDWSHFAGGGNQHPFNCSVRFEQWYWDGQSWLWGLYLYLGGGKVSQVRNVYGSPLNYASNGDFTGEWLVKSSSPRPARNRWHHLEVELHLGDPGAGNGSLFFSVDNEIVQTLADIPWLAAGAPSAWNHAYPVLSFGGGAGYEPDNTQRGSVIDYRNYRITAV